MQSYLRPGEELGGEGRKRPAFEHDLSRWFHPVLACLTVAFIAGWPGDSQSTGGLAAYPAVIFAHDEVVICLGTGTGGVEHPKQVGGRRAAAVEKDTALGAFHGNHLAGVVFTVGDS